MLTHPATQSLKLGLIGDNIARSKSPLLHGLAGQRASLAVRYDRLVPSDLGQPFAQVFDTAREAGYRGLNITYPYKETVVPLVAIDDPVLRAMGTVNTVLFDAQGPRGFSTDYTGFKAAYRKTRAEALPGVTLLIGAGGVGRAIAFGLADLGATTLRLADRDINKAKDLARDLTQVFPTLSIEIATSAAQMATGVSGIVNATPVGMVGYEGTPLEKSAMSGAEWAFDAVYTPEDTQFLRDATDAGLVTISGWELFFYQGIHAWKLFSGQDTDADWLRHSLHQQG